ncbi:MAG TPA: rhodanese-like domain-containing protein [Methanocella sp.]|uniref:rhodanese-like domain-containing protein n=1 Tax=Methanocella sp. TaxID=2052833 RepID=UPI002C3D618A|nr:rhodanese-like domain-containing protein [Methanocella sp.]HTY91047.1 rhodanese-like domain-containing protein [Methanocella sp.]
MDLYTEQVKDISVDDLKKRMKSGKGIFILDVRELSAYFKGHIPGACDLFDGEISNLKPESMDKDANFVVYGPGQARASPNPADRLAGDAVDRLRKLGFRNVMELRGGFEAWANAGNRVDNSAPGSIKPADMPLLADMLSGQRDVSQG